MLFVPMINCSGHQKAVTSICHLTSGPIVVSGSADSTVRVWNYENPEQVVQLRHQLHQDQVTGLSIHPTQQYFLSTSKDKTWTFADLKTGFLLRFPQCHRLTFEIYRS